MKMRKTYIVTSPSRRQDPWAVSGEGSLELREGPLWPEHPTKAARTAMLQAVPRHHQCHHVGLLLNRVIHLRMKILERVAVHTGVLFGSVEVLGKRGLRLAQIGRLQLHLLPPCHLANMLPEHTLQHRQRNVMRIKWEHEGK